MVVHKHKKRQRKRLLEKHVDFSDIMNASGGEARIPGYYDYEGKFGVGESPNFTMDGDKLSSKLNTFLNNTTSDSI